MEWLYPSQHLAYTATILCNSVAQNINLSVPKTLISKDTFSEVDDPHQSMLTTLVLNGLRKNGIPNHELTLKIGDVCLVTRALTDLEIANNSRVRILAICEHTITVMTMGERTERTVKISE